jgi:hypothetical protein
MTDRTHDDKRFTTLRAQYALKAHELHRSTKDDGTTVYVATKWALTRELASLDEAEDFLRRIGGRSE